MSAVEKFSAVPRCLKGVSNFNIWSDNLVLSQILSNIEIRAPLSAFGYYFYFGGYVPRTRTFVPDIHMLENRVPPSAPRTLAKSPGDIVFF